MFTVNICSSTRIYDVFALRCIKMLEISVLIHETPSAYEHKVSQSPYAAVSLGAYSR